MRLVLCVLLTVLLPSSIFAAQRTLTRSEAQIAVGSGDAQAAAALTMTTDQVTCLNECARRGHSRAECADACRPGLCHPDTEQPYCISR
jgi:hypothetical protein